MSGIIKIEILESELELLELLKQGENQEVRNAPPLSSSNSIRAGKRSKKEYKFSTGSRPSNLKVPARLPP